MKSWADLIGVSGTVLACFESYLNSRKCYVQVEGSTSTTRSLTFGIPQGSVVGLLLYVLYTAPAADIIKSYTTVALLCWQHTIKCHQLWCWYWGLFRSRVEHCVADIDRWMTNNKLKLNENKTELLVISSKYRSRPMVNYIQEGVETIKHHSCCKKFGSDIWPGYRNG